MSRSVIAPIEASLLVWARKSSRYSVQEAAKKIGVAEDKLLEWELSETKPTIVQLKKIANVYKRPLAVFFLPKPPNEYDRPFSALDLQDFRRLPESGPEIFSPALTLELRKAENRREIFLDLMTQLDSEIPEFNLSAHIDELPEALARRMRVALGVTYEEQVKWRDSSKALKTWINAIERQNILVFQTGYFGTGGIIDVTEMRGIAIKFSKLPIIVVNGSDTPNGRIFTLMHELCHLLLNMSAISDTMFDYLVEKSNAEITEIYCNRFAAEILIPMEKLIAEDVVQRHEYDTEWADTEIFQLSKTFSVSREAIVRRLLTAEFITKEAYRAKTEQYQEEYRHQDKRSGGSPPRDRMLLKFHGPRYISTILEAYHNDLINTTDACEYLGAKTSQMDKLERAFVSGQL